MRKKLKEIWNRTGRKYLIAGLLYTAVGFVFVMVPFFALDKLIVLLGFLMIGAGLFSLLYGITAQKKATIYALGILAAIFGLWLTSAAQLIIPELHIFLGLAVMVSGTLDLYHYIKIRYTYGEPELFAISVSALSVIVGIVIIADPFHDMITLLVFAGFALLGRGVLSFIYYRLLQELN